MKKLKAIIYMRYDGISFQKKNRMLRKELIEYCNKKNYKIIGMYIDKKKNQLQAHKNLNKLLAKIDSLDKPIIVTRTFSMLSRDLNTTLNIFDKIKKESFILDTVDGSFYNAKGKSWLRFSTQV